MTDTLKIIKCPACAEEMTKIFISDKGINIDVCANGCGGIFLDNQEIREFSNPNEDFSGLKHFLENKNFMPTDQKIVRICPACNTPMTKTNALGVEIDTCYNCGAIFLDKGEFEQVRTQFKKRKHVEQIKFDVKNDEYLSDFYKPDNNTGKIDILDIVISFFNNLY